MTFTRARSLACHVLSSTLLATAAIGAAVAAPSTAYAAEGLTGVTTDGRIAHLQTDTLPGMNPKPVKVTGLAAGERVVGLDRTPSRELLALTSAGDIDSLDATTGKATARFSGPVTGAMDRNGAVAFAVAPDGKTVRIIAADRDEIVDLATGARTQGGGLTFAAGDHHAGAKAAPSLDHEADGRLIGIDPAQNAIAVQTAVGAPTLSTLSGLPFQSLEPVRATVASDGSLWIATSLSNDPKKQHQSRLLRYAPATGRLTGVNGTYLGVKLAALADDGQVADDTTAPKGSIRGTVLRRHVLRGFSYFGPIGVKMNEPGQVTGQLLLNGKTVGFALASTYVAGYVDNVDFFPRKDARAQLRRAAADHRRAVVRVTVHDWAGNKRTYNKAVRLSA